MQELPQWARDALANVILLFEDWPTRSSPDIYGVYDGVPLPERDGGEPIEPAASPLPRAAAADFGDDEAELAHEIRVTVLHEIAHHFGIDDDRLEELGYG